MIININFHSFMPVSTESEQIFDLKKNFETIKATSLPKCSLVKVASIHHNEALYLIYKKTNHNVLIHAHALIDAQRGNQQRNLSFSTIELLEMTLIINVIQVLVKFSTVDLIRYHTGYKRLLNPENGEMKHYEILLKQAETFWKLKLWQISASWTITL